MRSRYFRALPATAALLVAAATYVAFAAVPIPISPAYVQDFNGIGTTATAPLPVDFRVDRPSSVRTVGSFAAAASATTAAGGTSLSTSAANGIYNFGATADAADRAIGFLSSGTATQSGNLYAQLVNSTGSALSGLQMSYRVEKYRGGMNAAGFRIQVFYSTDGVAWTSGGAGFLTAFPADAGNTGFNPAPGATVAVNAPLNVSIPNGGTFYVAWNYSVATGSTTTNAQALAIDDINISGTTDTTSDDTAPTVTTTAPAHAATNVAVGSPVVINFSETVNATASAFALQCPSGAPQTFTPSASPAGTFTLTPASNLPYNTVCTVTVSASQITDADANDPPDQMDSDFTFSFLTAGPPPPVATSVIINEVDADTPGADAAEFVELFDGGAGNTPLDGLVVVFFNGSTDLSYAAFDLDGFSTDANGYFTLGNAAGSGLVFGGNLLQNGADAVALYAGDASSFPANTPVTTANLQDALVYGTDDPDDPGLLALLNAGQPQTNENDTLSSQRCPNGSGGARNTSTYAPGAPTPGAGNTCAPPPTPSNSVIVISQLYGGGGNTGATYHNDYVELYNRGTSPVDIGGWSLQYAAATGDGWEFGRQPLGGTIGPGQYYLIALASGGADGAALPQAQINGQINMSGTSGKIALVNGFDGLLGNCPIADPHVMDLVGYGSADCREGTATAPAPGNTTAIFRADGGNTDTDRNSVDFATGSPNPRQTAPIVELGPLVLSSDPRPNGASAPRDATIAITFTEPVNVLGAWFDITCAGSGPHTSTTTAGGGQVHYITPNDNFLPGEQCTVTLFKGQIVDQDLDDSGPDTDTLPANYVWSFTVATGTAPPYPPSVHLTMGNPSGATASIGQPDNYLMEKPEFVLSYSRDLGRPNWVSWHLSDEWIGSLTRVDTFRPDPAVPSDWYRVQSFDFTNSGFDRGHMVPNADRDKETSIPINQATFLMSNMVAQAPDNNQGPWAAFENYLRTLLPADEIYLVAGGAGAGGTGSNGGVTMTLADGHVTVPAYTWKVALVIPKDGGDDISRVSCSSRTIAIIMPNMQGIRNEPWENYLRTVDAVETLTGYDLFSSLPEPIQRCVEAGTNGDNPPLVKGDQTIAFAAPADRTYGDPPFTVSATGGASGNPVTFIASGACTSGGANGATIAIVSAGSCSITALQTGSALYEPAADVARTMTVSKAAPLFSNLTSAIIELGTAATPLMGTLNVGGLVPSGSVVVTIGGSTTAAAIGSGGQFSASVATASLAASSTAYTISYTYGGDGNFTAASGTGTLTVVDTTAPGLSSVAATPGVLRPANHRMIDVFVGYQATDLAGAPACSLSVSSNEPINGNDDGNTSFDWRVIDAHHAQLRAERSNAGSGRLYTITVSCLDASGNRSSRTATVAVPR
jgi:endonuclease G